MTPKEALEQAISTAGSMQALADHLGITKGAVSQWKLPGRQVPTRHCRAIESLTSGVSRLEDLRPDVFGVRALPLRRATDAGHPGRQPPSTNNIFDTVPGHSVIVVAGGQSALPDSSGD